MNPDMFVKEKKQQRKRAVKSKNPQKRADGLHTRLGNLLYEINETTDDVKALLAQMLYSDATDEMRYERWNQMFLDTINFIEAPKEDEYDGRLTW